MRYLLLLLLAGSASAGGIVQGGRASGNLTGSSISPSSVSVSGNGNACLTAGPLNVDCGTPSVTVTSSMTVTGAGGLGVTYGVTAGSVTAGAITINAAASGIIDAVNTDLYLRRNGSPGNIIFSPNNAAETVRFQANGNVGIGTASPASKLHISSGTITIDGTGSPTTSQALCLATGGALGHCTSVVGAGGGCTCVSP